ncbi:MAG: electron transport complex protein RnfC [Firmicutes bacterium]|nr:electron transport complex protein RnfC [Bacillota bacterium]
MNRERETLIAKTKAAGVVGAGGAGFPTHVKLNARVDTVIVNGAECEPLLAVDVQLMEREAETLAEALEDVVEALGAEAGVIAIKGKHTAAVEKLEAALAGKGKLRLKLLKDYYPAGDEQNLVYDVTAKTVPEGGIPLAVGAVVLNVETLLNVAAALDGQPVTTTYVTVAGAVREPVTLAVPVGTPMAALLDLAGGPLPGSFRVIEGGPMTGELVPPEAVESGMAVCKKTTTGLIILPADHWLIQQADVSLGAILQRAQSACCQCRLCTDLCPRYLLGHDIFPHLVLNAVNHGHAANTAAITQAYLCCDCGVCDLFACPVELSPRRMFRALKEELGNRGLQNSHRREAAVRDGYAGRHIPVGHLIARLGLEEYYVPAPWSDVQFSPRQVRVPLKQHIGVPAEPLVQPGDRVETGQLIAVPPSDKLGAAVHASIPGRVREVTETAVVIAGE